MVALVIWAIYLVRGENGKDSPTIVAKSTSASPTPSPFVTASPSPTAPAAPTTSAPVPPPTTAPPTTAPPAIAPGSRGTVYVYTAPGGAANLDAATARFTAAGYAVKQSKAVSLNPAQTTVYYDSGMANDAAAMVSANVGVLAAAPRPPEYLSTGTLFVVVTANYA